jgi:DNA-binding beta-propeller fold protein YncE
VGLTLFTIAFGVLIGFFAANRWSVRGQARPGSGFAAVPGEIGGWDLTGPYEVVKDWPKPLSQLPGHEKWTWGSVEGVFAESPNRVFIFQRGELPAMARPMVRAIPEIGPSLSFPVGQVPFRNASQGPASSPPGAGGPGADPSDPAQAWKGRMGTDARWEHLLVVVDANGNITEQWTQWDSLFKRPHSIYINPYDPDKYVWVVDDHNHALFKFTHDGKQLVQTIGTKGEAGEDDKHFNRPTYIAWLPDSTMFVSDGYNGHRVVKLDKNGKFLMAWGEKGNPPNETRPGYFNVVHGIAADRVSRRIYVSDRGNRRMQVFDENGKFITQWPFAQPSSVNCLYIGADRKVWAFEDTTSKVVEYDSDGHLLYAWGTLGDWPGGLFNMHGASVDQEGNLYIAEVAGGRVQKFRPRPGANPEYLVSKPVYAAWK